MVIEVSGADLMDGTPIYDFKPYVPYTDVRNVKDGFAPLPDQRKLQVVVNYLV